MIFNFIKALGSIGFSPSDEAELTFKSFRCLVVELSKDALLFSGDGYFSKTSMPLMNRLLQRCILFIFLQRIFASYNKGIFQAATSIRVGIGYKKCFFLD